MSATKCVETIPAACRRGLHDFVLITKPWIPDSSAPAQTLLEAAGWLGATGESSG